MSLFDDVSPVARAVMRGNRSKDTKPELVVRRLVHALGYRFLLHGRDLPGAPDLVFPRRRKVVFVHGCFWHRHPGCPKATESKSRVAYWQAKFARNIERDAKNERDLRSAGWDVATVWECETRDVDGLAAGLASFLGPTRI